MRKEMETIATPDTATGAASTLTTTDPRYKMNKGDMWLAQNIHVVLTLFCRICSLP